MDLQVNLQDKENTMGSVFRFWGLAALVAAVGFFAAGCGADGEPGRPPVASGDVTVTPAHAPVARGESLQLGVTVESAGTPPEVVWLATPPAWGNVTAAGLLTVNQNAPAGSTITIRATVPDTGDFGTATVDIVEVATGVTVTSPHTLVAMGETLQLRATVEPAGAFQEVEWALVEPPAGVAVDTEGLLTVAGNVPEGTLIVRASAVTHPGVSGQLAVEIVTVEYANTPRSVTVLPLEVFVTEGDFRQFTAMVFPARAPQNVTWTVIGQTEGDEISADGLLRTVEVDENEGTRVLTVVATAVGFPDEVFGTGRVNVL